jgi:hypothetical protein
VVEPVDVLEGGELDVVEAVTGPRSLVHLVSSPAPASETVRKGYPPWLLAQASRIAPC